MKWIRTLHLCFRHRWQKRLEGSLAVTGDIGVVWPVMARRLTRALGVELAFVSHPQDTALGQSMRGWIVIEIQPLDRERMLSVLG